VLGVGAQRDAKSDVPIFKNIRCLKQNSSIHLYSLHEVIDDNDSISYDFVKEHEEEFSKSYEMLEDEKSRKVFLAYLQGMVSGVAYYENADENQYFNELTQCFLGGTFVDCGAYVGDSVEKFIGSSNGNYDSIYAIEADPTNVGALRNFIDQKNYRNVYIIPKGVGSSAGKFLFDGGRCTGSRISEAGNMEIEIDTLDNILGTHEVTFLKMDIEGSELEALKGARGIIASNMPAMAICVYHRRDDLIKIPPFIESFRSKGKRYRLYLRKHRFASHDDLVLYAIPTGETSKF